MQKHQPSFPAKHWHCWWRNSQARGKRHYLNFCLGVFPLPATKDQLCYFVRFHKNQGLRHQTVKLYLLAVRHLQVSQAKGDSMMGTMRRLELVIRELINKQAGLPNKTRLPITPAILHQIQQELGRSCLEIASKTIFPILG